MSADVVQKSYGSYAIALSLVCLSASITYFAQQLSSLEKVAASVALYRDVAPELVEEVAKITESIPLVVDEVSAVRKEIPLIMTEIAAVRATIPSVLAEVKAVRLEVPSVLSEVSALRKETIPAVLQETGVLQEKTIPAVLAESKALRSHTIPAVLTEVELSRKELPSLLDQANEVARTAGKSASEGAVSGLFTGIIRAPLNIVGGMGESVFSGKKLSSEDSQLVSGASHKVLTTDRLNATEAWKNSTTGHSGTVSISAMSAQGDARCRVLALTFSGYKRKQDLNNSDVIVCHDSSGVWKIRQ